MDKWPSPLGFRPCNHPPGRMVIRLHSGCLITIFPKRRFSFLPPVVFLARPSGDQLHRLGDNLSLTAVLDKKVNMVRSHRIIQDTRPETLLPLEKPLQPPVPVSEELFLIVPMSNVPHAAGIVMPIRSGHPPNYP
jgi:hypothetical protein